MPKLLHARAPQDALEEQKVQQASQQPSCSRRLQNARSDDCQQLGWTSYPKAIAEELGCHPHRLCASASIASIRRDSTGLAIARAPAATDASRKPSAP
jgi:hypothetical protein